MTNRKLSSTLVSLALLWATGCSKNAGQVFGVIESEASTNLQSLAGPTVFSTYPVFFKSGFEGISVSAPSGGKSQFVGAETAGTFGNGYKWENSAPTSNLSFERGPYNYSTDINYQDTDPANQTASIQPDPISGSSNKVLKYELIKPSIPDNPGSPGGFKGRIQVEGLAGDGNVPKIKDYYEQVDFLLPADFTELKNSPYALYDKQGYILLIEFFDDLVNYASGPNSFRVGFYLSKKSGAGAGGDLYIYAKGEKGALKDPADPNSGYENQFAWGNFASSPVPINSWVTIRLHITPTASSTDGRIQLSITPRGTTPTTANTVLDFTARVKGQLQNGYESFYPMKLYASKNAVEAVTGPSTAPTGKKFRVYWDNLQLNISN